MNPLRLLDNVYYSIAYICGLKLGYYKEKELLASILLGFLQTTNVGTIVFILWSPLPELIKTNDLFFIALCFVIFLIINVIRYKKIVTYTELSKKWGASERNSLIIKRIGVVSYILLTYVFLIFSVSID